MTKIFLAIAMMLMGFLAEASWESDPKAACYEAKIKSAQEMTTKARLEYYEKITDANKAHRLAASNGDLAATKAAIESRERARDGLMLIAAQEDEDIRRISTECGYTLFIP